jgi:hypothetical protein
VCPAASLEWHRRIRVTELARLRAAIHHRLAPEARQTIAQPGRAGNSSRPDPQRRRCDTILRGFLTNKVTHHAE